MGDDAHGIRRQQVVGIERRDIAAGGPLEAGPHAADDAEVGLDPRQLDARIGGNPVESGARLRPGRTVVEEDPLEVVAAFLREQALGERLDIRRRGVPDGGQEADETGLGVGRIFAEAPRVGVAAIDVVGILRPAGVHRTHRAARCRAVSETPGEPVPAAGRTRRAARGGCRRSSRPRWRANRWLRPGAAPASRRAGPPPPPGPRPRLRLSAATPMMFGDTAASALALLLAKVVVTTRPPLAAISSGG